ncbi:hypothetical protein JIR001_04430 [Polycladomyces abyssicola]|uniref:Uncharacterized protein n=1 Tax=Polycladomyces abyssicola TaxID=1125966 RepID=A0A8D5UCM9_9BACL|nr:hypothetical protein JIR001_04430 [Polycladomyces abyssicola]
MSPHRLMFQIHPKCFRVTDMRPRTLGRDEGVYAVVVCLSRAIPDEVPFDGISRGGHPPDIGKHMRYPVIIDKYQVFSATAADLEG